MTLEEPADEDNTEILKYEWGDIFLSTLSSLVRHLKITDKNTCPT